MRGKWLLLYLLLVGQLWGQSALEALELAEPEEGAVDALQVAQTSEQLEGLKIFINTATDKDLLQLPFLDVFQVHNLLQYRKRVRRIYGPYELLQIKGFDEALLKNLLPYLDFHPNPEAAIWDWKKVWARGRPQLALRSSRTLQTRAGYSPERIAAGQSHYLGDPTSYLMRFRWESPERLRFGWTLAKDAGEPFAHAQQPLGFDYLSWHVEVKHYKRLEHLIIGDFGAAFGQGLLLWTAFAVGKSSASQNIWRFGRGIQAYSGADESRFLRGLAMRWRLHPNLTYQIMASRRYVSATLDDSEGFTNIRVGGLHRTATELAARNNLLVQIGAQHLKFSVPGWEVGLTHTLTHYNRPRLRPQAPYGVFHPSGQLHQAFAADYRRLWRGLHFFGEVGFTNNSWGQVHGIQYTGHEQFQLSAHFRSLPPGFLPDYQAVFEGGSNRTGVFVGFHLMPIKKWQLEAYADWMRRPWLQFGADAPSEQVDYLVQAQYNIGWQKQLIFRYRFLRQEHTQTQVPFSQLLPSQRQWFRIQLQQQILPGWQLNTRLEWNQFLKSTESGWMGALDLHWKPEGRPFAMALRWGNFNTSAFATALYAFEPDLPLGFSAPALHGTGTRTVLVFQHQLRWGKYGLRLAHTHYANTETIGSGLDEIVGPYKTDVSLFFQWRPPK